MKDEIKEILDFKENADYKKLSVDEIVILKNCITNLQEENEHLDKVNCYLRKKINNDIYKQRNEKALDKLYCYGEVFDSKILQEFQKEMENILKGDKE